MNKVVLDTSAWVEIGRNRKSISALNLKRSQILMPAPVLGELLVAAYLPGRSSPQKEKSLQFVQGCLENAEFTSITEKTTEIFARLKAETLASGKIRGVNDLWIAASAIEAQAELITFDKKAYFEGLPGLMIRN